MDEKTQKELNTPLIDPDFKNQRNEDFLNLLIKLINEGKIELYRPSSLINFEIYDKLTEEKQGKADLEAMNMLAAIREIKDLFDNGFLNTFQMENLVERVRQTKERLETEGGNIFIV